MRLFLVLLSSALISCAGMKSTPTTFREGAWLEVRTAHAIIHTNVSADVARNMAIELERTRRALLLMWGPNVDPEGQQRIVILKRYADLEHFSFEGLRGFYGGDATGTLLVLAADGGYLLGDGKADEHVQVHELAHAVMYEVIKRQPRWLAEGLATYLENTRVDADNNVALGKVNVNAFTHVVRGGRTPIAVLRSWNSHGELSASDNADRYASSWAWVHFLFNAHPEQFVAYLQKIAAGENDQAAWSAAFPADDESLEKELTVYLASGQGAFVTLPLPQVSSEVTVTPLPQGTVHANLAHLYLSSPGKRPMDERRSLAQAELDLALAADPQEPLARTLQAMLKGGSTVIASHGGGAPAAPSAPQQPCPADIAADNVIEGESSPKPGTRVAEAGPGALGLKGSPESSPSFAEARAKLKDGEVAVFAGSGGGVRALILRPDDAGACVVVGWETYLGPKTTAKVKGLQSWTAPDGSAAVFVLSVQDTTDTGAIEQRWITLATDGHKAWAPLKGGSSAQLLAKEAKLRPQSGKLYLDVKVKGPTATVFAFRPESGQFEQLR